MKYDYLVVGTGLYGATFARKVTDAGYKVLAIDKRLNIAGNVFTEKIEGINVHKYGAHIFHTNNKLVWDYVNRFAVFNRFTNSPVANYKGELYSLPFNMYTFNKIWGVVTPEEAEKEIGWLSISTTDMYLPIDTINRILEKCGFTGAEAVFLSNHECKSKAKGDLYELIKTQYPNESIIHIGDNIHSDVKNAGRAGLDAYYYPNADTVSAPYRAKDMSYIVGSAYRGLVSKRLYSGLSSYNMEYEYGYIYGGLFVLGYCNFIHEYCRTHDIDQVVFLSRDGDILKKAYDRMFSEKNTVYAFWSRKAAAKAMAIIDRYDFYRRFIYQKINQGYSLSDVLASMDLKGKTAELLMSDAALCLDDELTLSNADYLKKAIDRNWNKISSVYEEQERSAGAYYKKMVGDAKNIAIVDIGWAGSGAMALDRLMHECWDIDCEVTGIIAGTNTIRCLEPDAAEPFLQSGKLAAYLFSSMHNRDVYKKHDPNLDYNVFWELLLSSPTKKLSGFTFDHDGKSVPVFDGYDHNLQGQCDIQSGILDFVDDYLKHFGHIPYMLNISGRDACAPMLAAASHNEIYLRTIRDRFDININVE